jgi:hypothetical protein
MASLRKKVEQHSAASKQKSTELAALKHAAADAQLAAQQAAADGPAITKLHSDLAALKVELQEARAAHKADTAQREVAERTASHFEGSAGERAAHVMRLKVSTLLCCSG